MTSFNGVTITYDDIGNPTSYYNGTSYSFTWQGRRLVGATSAGKTYSFTYNDDGIRTSKTVNGVEHKYYLSGDRIIAEEWDGDMLVYVYDATGSPIGMMYYMGYFNSNFCEKYWFEKNIWGDITGVYDDAGNLLIEYSYDPYGNCTETSVSNSYGAYYNPFRYRGYYYDADLGLYYLNSRYYDSNTCRFISADDYSVISATPMGLTDKNLFAYCDNNPIMRVDHGGQFWETIFDVASLAMSVADVCMNPDDPWAWAGLIGDAIDLIPFVSGVGEATDILRIANKVDDVVDIVKTSDNVSDVGEIIVKYGDEVKLPNQIKSNTAIDVWNDFLGPNQTSYNRFTGTNELDRIFSADGTRSIRFGNHEMQSLGTTKAHFHYEFWQFDKMNNVVHVKNVLQRLK